MSARSPSPAARALAPLTAVAGAVVVFAAIAIPIALHRAADSTGGGSPGAGAVRQADVAEPPVPRPAGRGRELPVEGAGTLLREGRQTKLCAEVVVTLNLPPSSASCGSVWVSVTGVPARWLRHTTTEGQAFSDAVRVEGVYAGGRLAVNRVREAGAPDPMPLVEPDVPCAPPAGGWRPGRGFGSGDDQYAADERLRAALGARRDSYTDAWEGHPPAKTSDYDAPAVAVMVVGTTDDPAGARADLSAIYPGNLCVHRVRYAAADLDRIAQRLRDATTGRVDAQPETVENKVRVRVVALDPATVALLDAVGRAALLVEEPMLQWLD